MNIAVLDIGSNNIKLEIHEISAEGHSSLLYSDKIPARLGHQVFLTQRLAPENMDAAIDGLNQFSSIISKYSCKETIALGTAALRETDSKAFIKRAQKEAGISIKVISGIEEARLVYNGVLAYTAFDGRTFFLNDIGGGSTEISVANETDVHFIESLRLGTVRLKEMFESGDEAAGMIEAYVKRVIRPYLPDIIRKKTDMGISTGGTARNLAEMVKHRKDNGLKEEKGLYILKTSDLRDLVDDLIKMTPREIAKQKGLDSARADIIMPGGILLVTLLEEIGIKESLICSKGLRDGAVVDFIYRKVNRKIFQQRQNALRLHGLRLLLKKFNADIGHAEHTANISMQLFDLLHEDLGITEEYREILFAAAMLHDIGKLIDYSGHHKHTFYMIMNSKLLGYSQHEQFLSAVVARYHRKSPPKSSHEPYQSLDDDEKKTVFQLAILLRMADSIDRNYNKAVKTVSLLAKNEAVIKIGLKSRKDLSLELWSLERQREQFEKVFNKSISFEKVRQGVLKNTR